MLKVKAKRRRRRVPRIVKHHITYKPERIALLFDGEHMISTRLQWRKRISKGFMAVLKQFVCDNEVSAVDLGPVKTVASSFPLGTLRFGLLEAPA